MISYCLTFLKMGISWFYVAYVPFVGLCFGICCLKVFSRVTYGLCRKIITIYKEMINKPKGLENLGNTCFMNAILQTLAWSPKLKDELKKKELKEFCKMTNSIWELLEYQRGSKSCRPISVELDVLAAARERNSVFEGHQQQDSFEMFNTIVEAITDEMEHLIKEKQPNKMDETVEETIMSTCTGVRLFFGTFVTVYKYSSCNHIECDFQRFSSITVPILKGDNKTNELKSSKEDSGNTSKCFGTNRLNLSTTDIERGIIHGLMKTEQFTDILSCRKCNHHGTEGVCWKKMLIYEPPNILVLHIDRFREDGKGGLLKRDDLVTYPEILCVDSFCSIASEVSTKLHYNLFGVVAHSGSLHCGHYVAYVKTKQRSSAGWYDELCEKSWKDPQKIKEKVECKLEKIEENETSRHGDNIARGNRESLTTCESEWYRISDARVTPCQRRNAIDNKNAYLLLYEKYD